MKYGYLSSGWPLLLLAAATEAAPIWPHLRRRGKHRHEGAVEPQQLKLNEGFDLQSACRAENRESTAKTFADNFGKFFSQKVTDAMSKMVGPAVMTVGEWHSNTMMFNFMAHLERAARKERINTTAVHVGLDPQSYEACLQYNKVQMVNNPIRAICLDLSGWLPAALFANSGPADRAIGNTGIGSCSYNMVIWSKPHILRAAVRGSRHGVLMTDTDVVIYRDLLKACEERLHQNHKTIVTSIERTFSSRVNTGTVYATGADVTVLDAWCDLDGKFLNDEHGDQAALQAVFNQNPEMKRRHWATLEGIVGQCGIKGPIATHYNCFPNKQTIMRQKGDWSAGAHSALSNAGLFKVSQGTAGIVEENGDGRIEAMRAQGDWIVG